MESRDIVSNENVVSGSGTSAQPLDDDDTGFIRYVTGFPPGFDSTLVGGPTRGDQPRNADCPWWRKVGAVKSKPGNGGDCDKIKVKKININDNGERVRVKNMLELFRKKFEEISENRNNVGDKKGRTDLMVVNQLKNEGKIIKGCSSIIGHVPGVVVGDKFRFRVELVIVGLHAHFERGIDTMEWGGTKIATCVVASEGHSDDMYDPNVLTYFGEGGKLKGKDVEKPSDQELKGGNFALCESMRCNKPVRVVKGFRVNRDCRDHMVQRTKYVYDGLYMVQSCEKKQGLQRNWVFEFKLLRCPGQPVVSLRGCKKN